MIQLSCLLLAAAQAAVQVPSESLPPATLWWGDFNGDGLTDTIALRGGVPRLLENLGLGEFADASLRAGLPELAGVRQAVWQDSDGDGDLDLLLVAPAEGLHLLRNEGGRFADVTAEAGLSGHLGVARASFLELDGDARADLWIVQDCGDRLLRQDAGGAFVEVLLDFPTDAAPPGAAPLVAGASGANEEGAPAGRATDAEGARDRGETSAVVLDLDRERSPSTESPGSGISVSGTTAGPAAPCSPDVLDQATGNCLTASSLPTLGALYPLGTNLNVDAAGRVGIGTIAPTHQLTIRGNGSDDVVRLMGTKGSSYHGARLNLGDTDQVHLWEYEDDKIEVKGDKGVWLRANNGNVVANGKLFQVVASAGTQFITGNVAIGPIAPAWPLDILAPQAVARLQTSTSGNGSVLELRSHVASPTNVGAINFVNSAGQYNGQIVYTGGDDLTLRVGGSERMRIDGGGTVGIGTASPTRKLEVAGGTTSAIYGHTTAPSGDGVYGRASATTSGPGWGVRGQSFAVGGEGVHGEAAATSGASHGVFGGTTSGDGFGVKGVNFAQPDGSPWHSVAGVYGEVNNLYGQGVWGRDWDSEFGVGVLGTTAAGSWGYGVFSEGSIGATGVKSFVQPIPGDPSRMLRFVCLEGNESGTYCRGQGRVSGGIARVFLPEDFRLATSVEGMTAQVTPRGPARLWVEQISLEELVVRADTDVAFDWTVNGLRRAFEDVETIVDNSVFIPRVRGMPYMPGASAEYRRLLVESGITHEDGTPNEATAASRGWELLDPTDPRAEIWLPPQMRPNGGRPLEKPDVPPAEPESLPSASGD